MKTACSLANFTWDGGTAAIGPKIAEVAQIADEAGFSSLTAMDHWFQIEIAGPPENAMLAPTIWTVWLPAWPRRVTACSESELPRGLMRLMRTKKL